MHARRSSTRHAAQLPYMYLRARQRGRPGLPGGQWCMYTVWLTRRQRPGPALGRGERVQRKLQAFTNLCQNFPTLKQDVQGHLFNGILMLLLMLRYVSVGPIPPNSLVIFPASFYDFGTAIDYILRARSWTIPFCFHDRGLLAYCTFLTFFLR